MAIKDEVLFKAKQAFFVDEDDPVSDATLSIIADNALHAYSSDADWDSLSESDQTFIHLLIGVGVYTHRAAYYAKDSYPVETPAGTIDKSVLVSQNQSMARELQTQYDFLKSQRESLIEIDDVGIVSRMYGRTVPTTLIAAKDSAIRIVYANSTKPNSLDIEWKYKPSSSILQINLYAELKDEDAPLRDIFSSNGVKEGVKPKKTFSSFPCFRTRLTDLPSGVYEIVVTMATVNYLLYVSSSVEATVP